MPHVNGENPRALVFAPGNQQRLGLLWISQSCRELQAAPMVGVVLKGRAAPRKELHAAAPHPAVLWVPLVLLLWVLRGLDLSKLLSICFLAVVRASCSFFWSFSPFPLISVQPQG